MSEEPQIRPAAPIDGDQGASGQPQEPSIIGDELAIEMDKLSNLDAHNADVSALHTEDDEELYKALTGEAQSGGIDLKVPTLDELAAEGTGRHAAGVGGSNVAELQQKIAAEKALVPVVKPAAEAPATTAQPSTEEPLHVKSYRMDRPDEAAAADAAEHGSDAHVAEVSQKVMNLLPPPEPVQALEAGSSATESAELATDKEIHEAYKVLGDTAEPAATVDTDPKTVSMKIVDQGPSKDAELAADLKAIGIFDEDGKPLIPADSKNNAFNPPVVDLKTGKPIGTKPATEAFPVQTDDSTETYSLSELHEASADDEAAHKLKEMVKNSSKADPEGSRLITTQELADAGRLSSGAVAETVAPGINDTQAIEGLARERNSPTDTESLPVITPAQPNGKRLHQEPETKQFKVPEAPTTALEIPGNAQARTALIPKVEAAPAPPTIRERLTKLIPRRFRRA